MSKYLKWFGMVLWIVGIIGAAVSMFTDEFLGGGYTDWAVTFLAGWCSWLQGSMVEQGYRITGVAIRQVKPGGDW